MANIKTVGIKDLKNNLRAHLRAVRRGMRILVSDCNAVVAELHEPTMAHSAPEAHDPIMAGWIQERVVIAAAGKKAPLPVSPVKLADGTARRLLDQTRDESRA